MEPFSLESEISIPPFFLPWHWTLHASLPFPFWADCIPPEPGLSRPGQTGSASSFLLLRPRLPPPTSSSSPSPPPPPPRGIVGRNKMWSESGAGRSPQCGARRAQPMGSADGGARGRGAGAGLYFRAARRPRSAAERSGRRGYQPRQAVGRVARGGARASGEARRATSSASARPRGCGSRGIPRRQRLLLQDEPRGHRPCPRFASAQRCSPGACADSPA